MNTDHFLKSIVSVCDLVSYYQGPKVISIIDLQDFSIQNFQATCGLRFLLRWLFEYSSSAFSIKHHTIRAALLVGTVAVATGCLAVSFSTKKQTFSRWCKEFFLQKAEFIKEVNTGWLQVILSLNVPVVLREGVRYLNSRFLGVNYIDNVVCISRHNCSAFLHLWYFFVAEVWDWIN